MADSFNPRKFFSLFGDTRILWVNTSGAYAAGLHLCCPLGAVACLDDGPDLDLLEQASSIQILRVEPRLRRRARPHDPAIEDVLPALGRPVEQVLSRHPRDGWALACPRPCRTFEKFASGYSRTAVHPAEPGIRLFDKRNLFRALDESGLPRLKGRWIRLSNARFQELVREFGATIVLQVPFGWAGSGTAIVSSESEFIESAARMGTSPVWTAPFAGPISLNINALALPNATVTGYPSVQLVGLPLLSTKKGDYCGNDFAASSQLPREILDDVLRQTSKLGAWLSSMGYLGIFGLDFVIESTTGRAYAIDLNPRWQGSTALSIQAEILDGRLPLAAAELAWKLGVLDEDEILRRREEFARPLACSQMILHSCAPEEAIVSGTVLPGVYTSCGSCSPERDAFLLNDCTGRASFVVAGALARAGTIVEPGACLGRIFQHCAVYQVDTGRLTPEAGRLAAGLYTGFSLSPTLRGNSTPARAGFMKTAEFTG